MLAPAELTANTAANSKEQPSSRRQRWDQRERAADQPIESKAAPAHQSSPVPQPPAPAIEQLPPLPPKLSFKLPISPPMQPKLRIKLRLPAAAPQAFASEASPPRGSSAQPGSDSRDESSAGRGHSAYVPPDCQDVARQFRNLLLEVEEALVAELQVCMCASDTLEFDLEMFSLLLIVRTAVVRNCALNILCRHAGREVAGSTFPGPHENPTSRHGSGDP